MPYDNDKALYEAHERWLEPPEDVVVGCDWQGAEIYDGEDVYVTPDGEYIVTDRVDEYVKYKFNRGTLYKEGFE